MTYIRARVSLIFGQIRPRTTELAASEKLRFPFFSRFCIIALRLASLPFGLLVDEFGKKTCHGTKRMQVLSQPIRFRNYGDMFLIHYFKINSF